MKFGKNHISAESQYPDNFVKLYAVFQKLDHLTYIKLKLRRLVYVKLTKYLM